MHGYDILGIGVKCNLFLNFVDYSYLVILSIRLINIEPPVKEKIFVFFVISYYFCNDFDEKCFSLINWANDARTILKFAYFSSLNNKILKTEQKL